MANIEWSTNEWDYLLKCFNESSSVNEAVSKFGKKFPDREYNAIRNKIRRSGQNPSDLISEKKIDSKKTVQTSNLVKELKNYIKQHKKVPAKEEFLQKTKIQEWQIIQRFGGWHSFIQRASKDGHVPADIKKNAELIIENTKLKTENTNLQQTLKEMTKEAVTTDGLRNLIHDLKAGLISNQFGSVKWLEDKTEKSTSGIPLLMLSDIHFDEVVNPAQIQYMNDFNRDIAVKRIQHTFNTTVRLLKKEISKPSYDGIVMALGGDIFSGNIHEELAETNEASIFQSMIILLDVLVSGTELLKKEFGKVFVPCVTGNHGRLHKKMRFKNRAFDNYEWVLYQFLARHFKDDKNVTFMIPDGPDAQFTIYDKTICLTHGDQFRGGSGISGIFTPLMLGMARKQKRNSAVKKNFDLMMLGHFHQLITTQNLIVNGCFPAGSNVVTPSGIKNIEDFKIGDEVLSRDGSIQKVTHTFIKESIDGLMRIKVQGLADEIVCTPNHLIWGISYLAGEIPAWIQGGMISKKIDWVHLPFIKGKLEHICEDSAFNIGKNIIDKREELTDEHMKLVGSLKKKIIEGALSATKDTKIITTKKVAYQLFQLGLACGEYPTMEKSGENYIIEFNTNNNLKLKNGEIFYCVENVEKDYSIQKVYDLEVTGEHTYNVNLAGVHNSVKGLDEYAFSNNFPYEPPQQALVIFHPRKGITHMMAVLCDGYKKEEKFKDKPIKAIF
jgi:hypothetical protein